MSAGLVGLWGNAGVTAGRVLLHIDREAATAATSLSPRLRHPASTTDANQPCAGVDEKTFQGLAGFFFFGG